MKKHSKDKIKELGMVFTPEYMVKEMLNKLPTEVFIENKTFLDNSCGDGAFLVEILKRKMNNTFSHKEALSTIYGVELDFDNYIECKKNLLLGEDNNELSSIVNRNIINADALDPTHSGWDTVGYYWSDVK
jgi:adenine-specific DNA-methyltransferase